MDIIQALVIAILQGASELFPVSSLGHAVVLPAVLNWGLDEQAPAFLPFLVMLHVGTAVALLGYFWRDWWAIFIGFLGIGDPHQVGESRRVLLLIVIATIPAVIVGFALEKVVRGLFGSPVAAAGFLVVKRAAVAVWRAAAGAWQGAAAFVFADTDGCVHHRLLAVRGAGAWDLAFGSNDRRRPVARHQSRGSGTFLVSDRDSGHFGCDRARGAEADARTGGPGCARHVSYRRGCGRHHGAAQHRVLDALFSAA